MKLILLIDDNEQVRLTFGMVLRDQGFRVIESDSSEAGLELARQQKPDLILTDINMPGEDGQALLRHIRNDPELCTKQVVLMTGRPDVVSPRKGMEQGADDFLVKPVSRSALLSCIEARLNRADIHWRVEDDALLKLRSTLNSQLPHEFFTPLAGILGLSEILNTDLCNLSLAEIKDLNRDIYQSAQRLHRTLRNYLCILEIEPKLEANTPPPGVLSSVKLRDCLRAAADLVAKRHGRREDLMLEPEACPILVAEPDLTVIVEELLDNAFKFSRRGTPVAALLRSNGSLLIVDSGRGMSKEEITQIGAFRQFDRKKHEQQGLGLGLYLVQKLAARNGAKFSLELRPEQGVQVRVDFQLSPAAKT